MSIRADVLKGHGCQNNHLLDDWGNPSPRDKEVAIAYTLNAKFTEGIYIEKIMKHNF